MNALSFKISSLPVEDAELGACLAATGDSPLRTFRIQI